MLSLTILTRVSVLPEKQQPHSMMLLSHALLWLGWSLGDEQFCFVPKISFRMIPKKDSPDPNILPVLSIHVGHLVLLYICLISVCPIFSTNWEGRHFSSFLFLTWNQNHITDGKCMLINFEHGFECNRLILSTATHAYKNIFIKTSQFLSLKRWKRSDMIYLDLLFWATH